MTFHRRMRALSLRIPALVIATVMSAACAPRAKRSNEMARIRTAIAAEIAKSVEATRTENIDAYMDQIPVGLVIRDESGEIITREQQRENTLRDWHVIERTRAIEVVIDSMTLHGDSATVFTSQRWDRLMYERDGKTLDTVVTTQRHREIWRVTPGGWRSFEIEELGGTVEVNGRPYVP